MFKKPVFALLFVLLVPNLITAGAWVKPKGGYYFKLSGNYMMTDKEFDYQGNEINYLGNSLVFDDTYFRDINISFYYEYGITDNITIWGDAAYKSYTSKRTISTVYATTEEIATTSGFGDMRILGVYGFLASPVAISFAAGPKFQWDTQKHQRMMVRLWEREKLILKLILLLGQVFIQFHRISAPRLGIENEAAGIMMNIILMPRRVTPGVIFSLKHTLN